MGRNTDIILFYPRAIFIAICFIAAVQVAVIITVAIVAAPYAQKASVLMDNASGLLASAGAIVRDPALSNVASRTTSLLDQASTALGLAISVTEDAAAYATSPEAARIVDTLRRTMYKLRSGIDLMDSSDTTLLFSTVDYVRQQQLLENSAFLLTTASRLFRENQPLFQNLNVTETTELVSSLMKAADTLLGHLQNDGFTVHL